jgi:DNA helicase II / ATP-dependent DNA helicase PcrA
MIDEILQQNLTDDQRLAAIDNSREILCLACAGSGKSRTLAYRIARIIAEGNTPDCIVAFTFTDKAAESIKRRVADALEKCELPVALVGAMYIGTIHSYCQHLLGEMNAKYRQYDVLDDNKLKLFLLSRYGPLGLNDVRAAITARRQKDPGMFKTINEVANAWKLANDEVLSFDDIETSFPELGICLKNIYARFDSDQYIDFSLMIRLVVNSLQRDDPAVNRALSTVRYLMVDEYQDVNPSQEYLIRGIHSRTDSLFVVGDDDQSIYAWRGADIRNIINFEQRNPGCAVHYLNINFRSTQAIVEATNEFIRVELGPQRIDKDPISNDNGNIRQFGNFWFNTREQEAEWIANRIQQLLGTKYLDDSGERGLTKSDFAILMRSVTGGTHPYYRQFVEALQNNGIEYSIAAEEGIFARPYAFVLRSSMELLRNPGAVSRKEALEFFKDWVLPHFPEASFDDFATVLAQWNTKVHTPQGGARRKVYPQNLVHDLLHAFGIQRTDLSASAMRDIGIFSGIILDIEKVYISIDSSRRFSEILNFLQNVAETGYDTSVVELVSRPDAVTISTVHKMKGLEFPVVFVVDVVNQRFPSKTSNYSGWLPNDIIQPITAQGLYETNIFSEARLFYTALTRAERFLYVTGSAIQPGLIKPKQQSRFKLRLAHNELINDPNILPVDREMSPERRRIDDNSMPTSFTEIKDYLECPMKYKYRKVYGFSPAVPELFGFGLTTHTSISKLHQEFPHTAPSEADAERAIDEVFHLKHVFPSRNPDSPGPYENAKNKAKEVVVRYAVEYPMDFQQSRQLEVRFEVKAGRAVITGAIDLLLKEDNQGNILEAKVIDFKSIDYPDKPDNFFWINLALQVQLYAHAARVVLNENARTGAVHLLKAENIPGFPNRVEVPITEDAMEAAIQNIQWAVNQILTEDFPHRPSRTKCSNCDFNLICSKAREEFQTVTVPPAIQIPNINGVTSILVRAFSDFE